MVRSQICTFLSDLSTIPESCFRQDSASLATIWSASKVQKPKEKGGKASKDANIEKERGWRKVEITFKDQRMLYLYFKKDASDELLEVCSTRKSMNPFGPH